MNNWHTKSQEEDSKQRTDTDNDDITDERTTNPFECSYQRTG